MEHTEQSKPPSPRIPRQRELESLGNDIYAKARPYLVEIGKDALITLALYVLLFIFEVISVVLPLRHSAGDFFVFVHSVALFCLLALFSTLSIMDAIRIHKKES